MTVRTKPVVRSRRAWETPERRNFFLNLGFGLVVLVALLVLIAAAAYTWYDQHLAPVASVNGQSINKDDYNRRFDVERVRLSLALSRIADEQNAGRLTEEEARLQGQLIQQRQQQIATLTLERLIDARIQNELARQDGIQVTDQDVEAKFVEEATRPEQRRAWLIEIVPEVTDGEEEPTAAAIAEAKDKAESALRDLEAGKPWEEVAAAAAPEAGAGDLRWISEEYDLDASFLEALFALQKDERTAIVEGEDGAFRIGRVTDIVEASVDPDFQSLIEDRGATVDTYRAAIRDDLVAQKLREKIEGQALAEGPQREVAEIFLENATLPAELPAGSVKTRHVLFSPKDDPQGAAQVPADDPAWKEAEDAARGAYGAVKSDPSTFDAVAREQSDEPGADASGGKLPWFDPTTQLDPAFAAAIFVEGLQPGQLLEPVRSAFGWHVIQVMYFPTDMDQANKLKAELDGGADFATLAREHSYGDEAAEGGRLGWIARFQLDPKSEEAIFATPVDSLTEPIAVDGDGVHLYRVLDEATREPDPDQRDRIEQTAFNNWYQAKKAAFDIKREVSFTGPTS